MDYFDKPQTLTALDAAFPASVKHLMPEYSDIPKEFKRGNHPACALQSKWFFSGLNHDELPPARDGIDRHAALRHLSAIQGSFEPKHEHKAAAVAFLFDKWFVFVKSGAQSAA